MGSTKFTSGVAKQLKEEHKCSHWGGMSALAMWTGTFIRITSWIVSSIRMKSHPTSWTRNEMRVCAVGARITSNGKKFKLHLCARELIMTFWMGSQQTKRNVDWEHCLVTEAIFQNALVVTPSWTGRLININKHALIQSGRKKRPSQPKPDKLGACLDNYCRLLVMCSAPAFEMAYKKKVIRIRAV